MLKFKNDDKDLLIWINGNTKRPEALDQNELAALKERGDSRVEEVPETPTKSKSAKANSAAVEPAPTEAPTIEA